MPRSVAAKPVTSPTIDVLKRSWRLSLQAQNKSPRTISQYLDSIRIFDEFLAGAGMPEAVGSITREHVETFLATDYSGEARHTMATVLVVNSYLLVLGERQAIVWVVREERMAFPATRRAELGRLGVP